MLLVVPYRLVDCPACDRAHDYRLLVEVDEEVVTFSGPADEAAGHVRWSIQFRCPKKNKEFSHDIPVPVSPGQTVQRVTSQSSDEAPPATHEDWRDAELKEWIKTSAATVRDFCRTMITSVLAAVPVYFVILKFLGFETVRGEGWRLLAIGPPFLLLASLLAFVLALRPVWARVDRATLAQIREKRLNSLNRNLSIGLTLFGLAVVSAVVVFLLLVWR
jgi:hypothetical protein